MDNTKKFPSKEERQKAFLEQCKKEGLTAKQIVERASMWKGVKREDITFIKLCP